MEWAQIFMGDFSQVEVALKNEDIKSQFVSMSLNSEKKLLDASDKVICLTDYLLDMLIKIYNVDKLKIAIIPNGIRDVFDKKENNTNLKRDLRKKYHFLSEEKVVLYVGRLDEVKGLNNLIDSFHLLLKKEKNSHLLIVGGGKIYDYYLKKTADIFRKVSYTGWIEKEKLYELMCVADVGVIPSLHEPFGYVALEMMMHSLPVVSTDSLSCIFDNNINGKLVPILDIEGKYDIDQAVLCEAIYYMLKETEMAKNIGRNGRKKFKEQFEIEYFKNNMVQLYSNLF
jgi:glycosyltransferase involved in cell wall biosynthesis